MSDYWVTIGLAALIGVAIGAIVSVWTVTRNIKHKSVIEERQKWRDALRELIPRLVDAAGQDDRDRVRNSIILRLNPHQDQPATLVVDHYVENPSRQTGSLVVAHFQDLLKRDWERAKIEASFFPFWATSRADLRVRRQVAASRRRTPQSGDVT
ncbi:hypothetical protein [Microbacterium sp. NPDC056569]|uniref:hypothetical protein n=1 Tax=Microbacterium sp. NPDC056569 TaxID=3345867 RepID=UPI0036730563